MSHPYVVVIIVGISALVFVVLELHLLPPPPLPVAVFPDGGGETLLAVPHRLLGGVPKVVGGNATRSNVWLGLFGGSCHVSWQFFHKQLGQRKACSAFLSPKSFHDKDLKSWLDTSLWPGAPFSWKIIFLTQKTDAQLTYMFFLASLSHQRFCATSNQVLKRVRNTSFHAQFHFSTQGKRLPGLKMQKEDRRLPGFFYRFI